MHTHTKKNCLCAQVIGMHVHMCAHVWKGASQVCNSGAILTVYFEAGALTADSAQLSGQQRPAATSAALKAQGLLPLLALTWVLRDAIQVSTLPRLARYQLSPFPNSTFRKILIRHS